MQQTPLYDQYAPFGAKVVDFHGWAMPIHFSGILDEHHHVRREAGIFDCSHMGEFMVRGKEAIAALDGLVYGDLNGLSVGRCRYTALLTEQAGILDDCVALRLSAEEMLLITNAGPVDVIGDLLRSKAPEIEDLCATTAKIDVQGPASRAILLELGLDAIGPLKFWTGLRTSWRGVELVVTRAGYTGELGYELYVPGEAAADMWQAFAAHPAIKPCGLGARDTLRTEMGYPLYGVDVNDETTPLEASMDRFIAWDSDFRGKARLKAQRDAGDYAVLTPLLSPNRRAPRPDFDLYHEGETIGRVTSGTFGPSVGRGVGLGYVLRAFAAPGTRLTAGPKKIPLEVGAMPLYKEGTCRMKVGG
jgi:aminomethyltransferase